MNQSAGYKKFLLLTTLATLFSLLFVFFGAPFLRLIRNIYGAKTFWFAGLGVFLLFSVTGMFPMSLLLGSCWLSIGIFTELEERGHAGFWTGMLSAAVATAFLLGGSAAVVHFFGIDLSAEVQKSVDSMLAQLSDTSAPNSGTLLSGLKIDAGLILSQMPSVLFVLFVSTLAYGLALERKFAIFMSVPYERIASQIRLLEFKLPDAMIWVTMVSFLGSFLKINNQMASVISMNLFNVMIGLYFFQGLAVVESAMRVFRAGLLIRFFVYFVVVFQLFFILSAVGFVDYWIDFRKRFRQLKTKEKNQNSGEHL